MTSQLYRQVFLAVILFISVGKHLDAANSMSKIIANSNKNFENLVTKFERYSKYKLNNVIQVEHYSIATISVFRDYTYSAQACN